MRTRWLLALALVAPWAMPTPACASWTQQGPAILGDAANFTSIGYGIALSGDGNTFVTGSSTHPGHVVFFTRSGDQWSSHGRVDATGLVGTLYFGMALAISGNGSTAVIGVGGNDDNKGGAWIFERSGDQWIQTAELSGNDVIGNNLAFGSSVAVAADGNTVLVGVPHENGAIGAGVIFVRSNGQWTQQGPKLVGTGLANQTNQGSAVALSGDGNVAVLGAAPAEGVFVFKRTGGSWSQMDGPLSIEPTGGVDYFGSSVAISNDGKTIAAGASEANAGNGAIYVFTLEAGKWVQQGTALKLPVAANQAFLGESLSMSGDGSTILVPSADRTSLRTFSRVASIWSLDAAHPGIADVVPSLSGYALSGDGGTLVEAATDGTGYGTAWVFVRNATVPAFAEPKCDRSGGCVEIDPVQPETGDPISATFYVSSGLPGDAKLSAPAVVRTGSQFVASVTYAACVQCSPGPAPPYPVTISIPGLAPGDYQVVLNLESDGSYVDPPPVITQDGSSVRAGVVMGANFTVISPTAPITVQVVEYYHTSMDHYFMTPDPGEIALLDARQPPFQDWIRTGYSFTAYRSDRARSDAVPVCRFFNDSFAPKSSHFYAAKGLGCEETLAHFPDWVLETSALFSAQIPTLQGNCPDGTTPVYRAFNNGLGGAPNHRYSTDYNVIASMAAEGWVPEGYGAGVAMCAVQ